LDYLDGKLTNEEAHDLEKLILEDPLYAEALEGLESLTPEELHADLAELDNAIAASTVKKPYLWYRVAAAIVIVAVASSVLYLTLNQFQISSKEETLSLRKDQDTEMAEPETTQADEAVALERTEQPDKVSAAKTMTEEPVSTPPPEKSEQKELITGLGPDAEDNMIDDVDNMVAPVQETGIQAETAIEEEVFDEPVDLGIAETATVPAEERNARSKRNARAMDQPAMPAAAALETVIEPEKTPRPVVGFEAFNQYVENSLVYPAYARQHSIQGIVELIFTVDADSIPRNIEVARSVGGGCDEEAVRILREGPKWIPVMLDGKAVKNAANLEIVFRLK